MDSVTNGRNVKRFTDEDHDPGIKISIPNGANEDDSKPPSGKSLYLFGFDVSALSRRSQFLLGSFGIFGFYIAYGYLQEVIFRIEGFKPFGFYLTLVQFALYYCLAATELFIRGTPSKRAQLPMKSFLTLSVLTVGTMGFSNASLGYLNYPTQLIFKCCKLIPTMIGGVLIQGKRYNCIDVTAMLTMCLGLIMFTLADRTVQPNFNLYGVLLISTALCADGAIGNVQEHVMKVAAVDSVEIVLYSYGFGFFIILGGLIVSGQLVPAFMFCLKRPLEIYWFTFWFSVTGYVGIQFVLLLVNTFGALPAVTVTTCRKSVTIILSFLLFTKPFTFQYVWSGALVIAGIYLSLYSKNRASWNAKIRQLFEKLRGKPKNLPQNISYV